MLRTAQLLPPKGPLTLGFDPDRFQTEPPVCYRASWQLPGPDLHRQATTSFSLSDQLLGITSNFLGARIFEARDCSRTSAEVSERVMSLSRTTCPADMGRQPPTHVGPLCRGFQSPASLPSGSTRSPFRIPASMR